MAFRRLERFWSCLETIPGLSLILEDWQSELGEDFFFATPFLQPTLAQARTYPCPRTTTHGCRRDIRERSSGNFVAFCSLPSKRCSTVSVEESQLVLHGLRTQVLCRRIASAFELEENVAPEALDDRTWSIGVCTDPSGDRWPVYLAVPQSTDELRRFVVELLATKPRPFLLMTPTQLYWDARTTDLLQKYGSCQLTLQEQLEVNQDSEFVANLDLRKLFTNPEDGPTIEKSDEYVFRRKAQYWEVIYDEKKAHMRDSKGMRCLSILLHNPGKTFNSLALNSATSRKPGSLQELVQDGLPRQERTGIEYLREQRKNLTFQIEEADRNNDFGAERLRSDLAEVTKELLSSVGPHGQPRLTHDVKKRAYDNVAKAMRAARESIASDIPAFEAHLKSALQTGVDWCYRQEAAVHWLD